MIIVVEGVDNSGKTTLAQYLAKQLRAVYLKVERPKKGNDLTKFNNLLQVARMYSGIVVADRHVAISEPIYGPICRGKHDLDLLEVKMCIQELTHIVYCRPPNNVILDSLNDRPQMSGVDEHIKELIDAYDALFADSFGPNMPAILRYDFTTQHPDMILEQMTHSLTKSAHLQ